MAGFLGPSNFVDNLKANVALHDMHYNFGRIHKTLRVTPAMEAGISDHVWSAEEIARSPSSASAMIRVPMMNRRRFLRGVGVSLFAAPRAAEAQQSKKTHRIGLLIGATEVFVAPYIEIFRQTLRALGYVQGRDIALEYRYADGHYGSLPVLATDLVTDALPGRRMLQRDRRDSSSGSRTSGTRQRAGQRREAL